MASLEKSEVLGRKIRHDTLKTLGIPTWTLAEQAIRAGRIEEGLELMHYGHTETAAMATAVDHYVAMLLDYYVGRFGEDEFLNFWKPIYARLEGMPAGDGATAAEYALESVWLDAEFQRGFSSGTTGKGDLTVWEEPDRYVVRVQCGTGGRLRKEGLFGVTKKAHPWSWSKVRVPYYCCHCCLWWEIMSIDARGYPVRVNENVDKPQEPCLQYFYKNPASIPEEYFTRVGKKKDPSKLRARK